MKVVLAQLNPIIGDLDGNYEKLFEAVEVADKNKSDLIIFPELFLTGYPPRDILLSKGFILKVDSIVKKVLKLSCQKQGLGIVLGVPFQNSESRKGLYNAALVIFNGKIIATYYKQLLPVYDIFDEQRYFEPGKDSCVFQFKNKMIGVTICEDLWGQSNYWHKNETYLDDPLDDLAEKKCDLIINLSASPFRSGVESIRYEIFKQAAEKCKASIIMVNQVGANDELVFDGNSMVINKKGGLVCKGASFKEEIITYDLNKSENSIQIQNSPDLRIENIYNALVLGIKDYVQKCGFKKVVVGLSGGIDSAVVCALAVAALGSDNVSGIGMPSKYSSQGSIEDANKLAKNLEINIDIVPISDMLDAYLKSIKITAKNSLAEENIQARIRGNILMAHSNDTGAMVLSTGNKSEMSVGYCTLYGDMSGGLSVLADVLKTDVYHLANYMNKNNKEIIPQNTIDKPPSAELKPDQKDQDTLPDYNILDGILYGLIDENKSIEDVINAGYDPEIVMWVVNAIRKTEYKRRQAAPGIKVSQRAFGIGRRMPIAAKW